MSDSARPLLRSVVLDTTDARASAEFYRRLLGYEYRPGFEPPTAEGDGDRVGEGEGDGPDGPDWILLAPPAGGPYLAFQKVAELPESTWPTTDVPQQLHLDLTVPDPEALAVQHARALGLGARLLLDGSDDPEEPIYVYADPDGHPFCIFVLPT